MNYKKQVQRYEPKTKKDEAIKKSILYFIDKNGDEGLSRENSLAHFTASSIILNEDFSKILMIHHKIYDTWTWQGGHADGEKNLLKVALKEALEETGLHHITVIKEDDEAVLRFDILPVQEHLKNGQFISNHLHLNAAYIFQASEKEELKVNKVETNGIRWVAREDIDAFANEPEITPIYHKLINMAEQAILASRG